MQISSVIYPGGCEVWKLVRVAACKLVALLWLDKEDEVRSGSGDVLVLNKSDVQLLSLILIFRPFSLHQKLRSETPDIPVVRGLL